MERIIVLETGRASVIENFNTCFVFTKQNVYVPDDLEIIEL